ELLRLSRRARVAAESAPPALHDYWLREMDFSTGEAALIAAPPGKTTCEYVFFPGCQLGAYRPEHVLRPLEALREQLDVGVFLGCCGAPAYWAGDDDRLDANTAQIRAAWERLGQPTFVFACATCARVFSEILPEIDGVSLYEKLADADKLAPAAIFDSAAVFDPCASGDDEDMQNAVRALATRSGVALTELAERGKCCGHGGHIRLANPSLYEEITANRAGESELPYIVYCANCREVFASRGKACAHILDVAFGLSAPATPDIDARRKNSIEVKRMVTKQFAGGDFSPTANPWDDIELIIDAETAERIDRKLIAQSDIREAIYLAQRDGDRFTAPDGSEQCSMIKAALVYWVMYRRLGDSRYEITDAYYHRMKFGEESDNG
ncbi:MAG: (Fe-S)-binding protein, partial [Oscillospiraceae bacterium]|nr:(Fe-S)-binding protein [Oscillospiraceae bacterium]